METMPFRIAYYTDENGNKPFREWLNNVRDQVAAVRIRARLTRVRSGNFGSVRNVGEGVVELKIDHGPVFTVFITRLTMERLSSFCAAETNGLNSAI